MTIYELADIYDLEIIIRKYPRQKDRWSASFENAETKNNKEDIMLAATYGDGDTPMLALQTYIDKIKGKLLVLFSTSKEYRKEFFVPKTLTIGD